MFRFKKLSLGFHTRPNIKHINTDYKNKINEHTLRYTIYK